MKFGVSVAKQAALERRMAALGIRERDLVEHFIRSAGPGGQNVNKVETGVYLKHIASGVEVKMIEERSQALNRFLARRVLCERLEARINGERSAEQRRILRLRRQKRKRSKRAQEKVLKLKRERGALKAARGPVAE